MIPTTPTRLLSTGSFARPLLRGCSRKKCDLDGRHVFQRTWHRVDRHSLEKMDEDESGSKRCMQRLLCGTLDRKEGWGSSKFAIHCHQREQHWLKRWGSSTR